MRTKISVILLILSFAPSYVLAACQGDAHATMTCADGKVYDTATKACIPVTG